MPSASMIVRALRLRHGRLALPRRAHRPLHVSAPRCSALESTVTPNAAPEERVGLPQFAAAPRETSIGPNTVVDARSVPLHDPNHPVALDYAFAQHNKKYTSRVGSTIAPHYKPHELLTRPPAPHDITLEALIAAQTHLGHATSLWNPSNARYIFGVRGDHDPIHIISPDATAAHLRRAAKVVRGVAERGGLILFVGTRQGQARAVVKAAELTTGCHLFTKWIPGSITNGQQILGRCEKRVYTELDEDVTEKYSFQDQLYTTPAIKPDLVVCLNPLENYILLHECGLNNIPTIGIIDTDANPTWVTYPIPANDDSLRAVQFICGVLGRAGQEGQEQRLRDAKPRAGRPEGRVVYGPTHGLRAPQEERSAQRGGNSRAAGTAQRMKVPVRSGFSQAAIAEEEEPLFPDDFDGADVRQHEADQALLDSAEKILFENDMASAEVADGAAETSSSSSSSSSSSTPERTSRSQPPQSQSQPPQQTQPEDETELEPELENNQEDLNDLEIYAAFNDSSFTPAEEEDPVDLSAVDPSLVDETYLPAVEKEEEIAAVREQDVQQFGIKSEVGAEVEGEVEGGQGEGGEEVHLQEGMEGGRAEGQQEVEVKAKETITIPEKEMVQDVDQESQKEVDAAVDSAVKEGKQEK